MSSVAVVVHGGYKVDCKSSGSPPVKHEVKPLPMNFSESVQCGFSDKSCSQPRRNVAGAGGADAPTGPPRKWKHRHINRHFSSTSDHQADAGHRAGPVSETAAKAYPSPSWLVAERPVPLSSVCHQGLPVVKRGSPVPPVAVLPNDLSRRFLPDGTDVGHAAAIDAERNAMLRKRRLDDRREALPFAVSPNVSKFPAFNYGITPVDIATGYVIIFVTLIVYNSHQGWPNIQHGCHAALFANRFVQFFYIGFFNLTKFLSMQSVIHWTSSHAWVNWEGCGRKASRVLSFGGALGCLVLIYKPACSQTVRGESGYCKPASSSTVRGESGCCKPASSHTVRDESGCCEPASSHTVRGESGCCEPAGSHTVSGESGYCKPASSHAVRGESGCCEPSSSHTVTDESGCCEPASSSTVRGESGYCKPASSSTVRG